MKRRDFLRDTALALVAAGTSAANASALTSISRARRTPESVLNQFLNPDPHRVLVCAHRGDWRNSPENSIQSLNLAVEMGADLVEMDIRKTKDNVLVVMHDASIDRTTMGKGLVEDLSWSELKHLQLRQGDWYGSYQILPSFEEYMDAVKGKPILLILDDKTPDIVPDIYAILKNTGTIDHGIFKGFDSLSELRKKYSAFVENIHYMPFLGRAEDTDKEVVVSEFYDHYRPAAFGTFSSNIDGSIYTKAIPETKARGTSIYLSSLYGYVPLDDEKAMEDPDGNWGALIKLGANTIISDRPRDLLTYLRRKNLHD